MGSRRLILAAMPVALLLAGSSARADPPALPDNFADQLVVSGLNQPSSLDFLPDGRILIVEQVSASVRLVVQQSLVGSPLITIPDVNTSGGERGLLGVARDAAWPGRPYVYVYFTRTPGNTCYISRYTASGDLSDSSSTNLTLGSRYDLITDIPDNASNHNSGTLRFGPDGNLYASLGDDANNCTAQDSSDFRGVILRMTVADLPDTGSGPPAKSLLTPPDNPFPATDPEAGLAFCYGLRNPFRFHIDPETGTLYIGDVGQSAFEELDEATGSENFGWPFREGPNVRVPPTGCSEPGGPGAYPDYDDPIGYYDRSGFTASIIGGPLYRPVPGGAYSFPPEYDGAVFFGEFYQGFIRVLKKAAGVWGPLPAVPGQPNGTDWATGFPFVPDYRIGPDGAIYYLQSSGTLRRIVYEGTATGIPGNAGTRRLRLSANPYRGITGPLEVTIPSLAGERIAVRIFAITGAPVRTLFEGPAEGTTTVTWDGRDASGRPVPAGVYLVQAVGAGLHAGQRVVVLR